MIELLASQLCRNDEEPNIELAEKLCDTMDAGRIAVCIDDETREAFIAALSARIGELTEAQKSRVLKLIRKL